MWLKFCDMGCWITELGRWSAFSLYYVGFYDKVCICALNSSVNVNFLVRSFNLLSFTLVLCLCDSTDILRSGVKFVTRYLPGGSDQTGLG